MTDREKLARQWAELSMRREVLANKYDDTFLSEEERAAAEHILATTEPELPELNLWDGVEMYGREWVVWSVSETGSLGLLAADGGAYTHDFAENTTPNGKRYELREIVEPDHPEVLTTVEDYENAPEGTLAASMHGEGYFHNATMSRWESTHGDWKNYAEMESSSSGRMVLRWGWDGKA